MTDPLKRDWLGEAIGIAEGRLDGKPKKEHILALGNAYLALCQEYNKLGEHVKKLISEAQRARVRKGLSIMPTRPEGEET